MYFVPGEDYLKLPRAPETWVVKDLLPTSGFCCLYGPPKIGKSFAALGLAIAVSTDDPAWLGLPIHTRGPVAYIQADTPRSLWAENYIERVKHAGYSIANITFADLDILPNQFNIMGEGGPWLTRALTLESSEVWFTNPPSGELVPPPVLVVVDTLRDCHGVDENDAGAMRNMFAALVSAISRPFRDVGLPPPATCLIMHSRKDNPDRLADLLNDARGSNYVVGRMDGILKITSTTALLKSRTAPETRIRLKRLPCQLWTPDDPTATYDAFLTTLPADLPMRELARKLQQQFGIQSQSTARRRVEEWKKKFA